MSSRYALSDSDHLHRGTLALMRPSGFRPNQKVALSSIRLRECVCKIIVGPRGSDLLLLLGADTTGLVTAFGPPNLSAIWSVLQTSGKFKRAGSRVAKSQSVMSCAACPLACSSVAFCQNWVL